MTNKFNIGDEVYIVLTVKPIICKIVGIYIKDNTIWYKIKNNNFEYDTDEAELLKYNVKENANERNF